MILILNHEASMQNTEIRLKRHKTKFFKKKTINFKKQQKKKSSLKSNVSNVVVYFSLNWQRRTEFHFFFF